MHSVNICLFCLVLSVLGALNYNIVIRHSTPNMNMSFISPRASIMHRCDTGQWRCLMCSYSTPVLYASSFVQVWLIFQTASNSSVARWCVSLWTPAGMTVPSDSVCRPSPGCRVRVMPPPVDWWCCTWQLHSAMNGKRCRRLWLICNVISSVRLWLRHRLLRLPLPAVQHTDWQTVGCVVVVVMAAAAALPLPPSSGHWQRWLTGRLRLPRFATGPCLQAA